MTVHTPAPPVSRQTSADDKIRDPLWHTASLALLYAVTIAAVAYLVLKGADYWSLPLTERPHHPLHEQYKPSGAIGHGIGIIGSAMMLILLLYSLRKRSRSMQRAGNIRYWLNYHIWLGITGPLLVLFHTSFKFGGIVSISFYSMMAVALSGVLGRYIYLQIPRSLGGQEFSARELEEMDRDLQDRLAEARGVDEQMLTTIQQLTRERPGGGLLTWILHDIGLPARLGKLRKFLHSSGKLTRRDIQHVVKLAKQRAQLRRRMTFLGQARKLLHHWHVFHKPFAIVMLVIMVVHVVVTILFGYKWIF